MSILDEMYNSIMNPTKESNTSTTNSVGKTDATSGQALTPFASGLAYQASTPTTDLTSNVLGKDTPWYQNSELLGNAAGLGSALVGLASLPSQIELANTQTDALKQNISTAKEEQSRRNNNISSFNSVRG